MNTIEGIVQAIAVKEPKENVKGIKYYPYGVLLNDSWYNGASYTGSVSASKGDKVKISVNDKGLIQGDIQVVSKETVQNKPPSNKESTYKSNTYVQNREDSFKENQLGQQVGNAMKVASDLLVGGHTVEELHAMCVEVLKVSEKLKQALKNGELDKVVEAAVNKKASTKKKAEKQQDDDYDVAY